MRRWSSKPVSDDEYRRRLLALVKEDANGCWIFQGTVGAWGYGQFCARREIAAHRASYHLFRGPIPKGMRVCHTCDVRLCCNPDHLWLGTQQQNIKDCAVKGRHTNGAKTHCRNGHEYTAENTRYNDAGKGRRRRSCLICQRAHQRIRAGWPKELAFSTPAVPHGYEVVGANWKQHRKEAA